MLNIRIEDGKTHVDGAGKGDDLIIECGFAMCACVDILCNKLGKGADFIRDMFDICMEGFKDE